MHHPSHIFYIMSSLFARLLCPIANKINGHSLEIWPCGVSTSISIYKAALTAFIANYFTLDVISDSTFGHSFSLITSPSLRWLIDAIVAGNQNVYLRLACPWLFNLPFIKPARWLFPSMNREKNDFITLSNEYTAERMKMMEQGNFDRKDIMAASLAAQDPKTEDKLTQMEAWSEAHLMIAAGEYLLPNLKHKSSCIYLQANSGSKIRRRHHLHCPSSSSILSLTLTKAPSKTEIRTRIKIHLLVRYQTR